MKLCQCCGMPLTIDVLGTNKDGSKNEEYCKYCYEDGEFSSDCTMEEMISICTDIMMKDDPSLKKDIVQKHFAELFPQLKRWKK